MDLRTYMRAVRKNWWMVVLALIIGAGASSAYVIVKAPTYASSLTFFVNTSNSSNTVTSLQDNQYAQERVNSYVLLMSSERLAKMVIADTGVNVTPTELTAAISARSELNTVLLTATVTDSSPERSLQLATSISGQFVKLVGSIDPTVQLEVTSGPSLYPYPVAPSKKLDVGLGVLVGLIVGLLAAVLRELLDTSIRSREVCRAITGVPLLGQISFDSSARKSPLITGGAKSIRAEAFRQLRTNLQFIDADRPANVIVVTSSVAFEGKSTTATNLAVTFADAGQQVLLIEADLRRPRVADYLGLEGAVGLTNVLASQVDVADVLQPWGKSGSLMVLPSGSIPPNPSELLGSKGMIDLIEELRAQFQTIIVDTPPLLPVTDAAVVAANADGAVVVVRYGKTKRQQVATAIASLQSVDARILGCVLTMSPAKGVDSYMDYDGYGYYETGKGLLTPLADSSVAQPQLPDSSASASDAESKPKRGRQEQAPVHNGRRDDEETAKAERPDPTAGRTPQSQVPPWHIAAEDIG